MSRDCSYRFKIQKARLYGSGLLGHPVPHAEHCLYSLDPPLPQLSSLETRSSRKIPKGQPAEEQSDSEPTVVCQGAPWAAWNRRDSLGYQRCLVSLGIPLQVSDTLPRHLSSLLSWQPFPCHLHR